MSDFSLFFVCLKQLYIRESDKTIFYDNQAVFIFLFVLNEKFIAKVFRKIKDNNAYLFCVYSLNSF